MRRIRVRGVEGDRVELTLGDDDLHLVRTQRGSYHNTVMVTGRGLHKIVERAALHLGYRLERIT